MLPLPPVVIDTNVVLDLFLYQDPCCQGLYAALQNGHCRWLGTQAMRDELQRVLGYPRVARRLTAQGLTPVGLLAEVDRYLVLQPEAAATSVRCRDPDDQKFLDLAVAHQARLLSKDREVLCLAKPLWRQGVTVSAIL